jgi:hypothetical protein
MPIVLRDLIGSYTICFGWEYMLYSSPYAAKLEKYKMNPKYPSSAQIRHDQYHTFFCVLTASAVEVLALHLYATGRVGAGTAAWSTPFFDDSTVASNCAWVALTTYWRLTHFWFARCSFFDENCAAAMHVTNGFLSGVRTRLPVDTCKFRPTTKGLLPCRLQP